MIGLLIALHPRRWRRRYGEEYRALLESAPLTVAIVLDVLRNAGRLHLAAHPALVTIPAAVALSAAGETIAVQGHYSDNILWIPADPLKAVLLAAVTLPWVMAGITIRRRRKERLGQRISSTADPRDD